MRDVRKLSRYRVFFIPCQKDKGRVRRFQSLGDCETCSLCKMNIKDGGVHLVVPEIEKSFLGAREKTNNLGTILAHGACRIACLQIVVLRDQHPFAFQHLAVRNTDPDFAGLAFLLTEDFLAGKTLLSCQVSSNIALSEPSPKIRQATLTRERSGSAY